MSRENVEKFYQKLVADKEIQKKLQAATAAAAEQATVSVAGTQGFAFSLEELRAHLAEKASQLGEEDLDKVAGGVAAMGAAMCIRASQAMACRDDARRCVEIGSGIRDADACRLGG